MTAFSDFLASPTDVARWGNWLAIPQPDDPNGSGVTLYYSSHQDGFATIATDSPASTLFPRRVMGGLQLEASIWQEGFIGGGSLPAEAEIVLDNADGGLDAYAPSEGYRWDGRTCTVRFGRGNGRPSHSKYMAYADFQSWTFEMGEPRFALDVVKIPLYGLERRFEAPLQNRVYAGTGLCLDFAAGAYATCGTPAKLDLTGNMTAEFRGNFDNFTNNRFVCTWNVGATQYPWSVRTNTSGNMVFAYTHGGGTAVAHATSFAMTAGRFYHVAVSISGTSGTWTFYDTTTGVETIETFTLAAAPRDARNGTAFEISRNSGAQSMVGRLDELRVWNTTRTAAQIREMRHGEFEVVPTALVGYWKFNDASPSTTVTDAAATPANGTLAGTYTWMPSLEGGAALAGRVKPILYGKVQFREAILLDAATQLYQIADHPLEAINAVHEGMLDIASGGADIASEKTFLTTTPAAGTYRTHLARGLFKLGSTPTLPVTFSAKGHNVGGYVDTKGAIIRRIVTTRGASPLNDPAGLVTASFTQMETDDPSINGEHFTSPTTIREALDLFAAPGAWWGYGLGGSLFGVYRWDGPAGSATATFDERSIEALDPQENRFRVWRLELAYGRIREHSEPEISATVKTTAATQRHYQRGRMPGGWTVIPVENPTVRGNHPRAQSGRFESTIQYPDDGASYSNPQGRTAITAEANRILALLSSEWTPYQVTTDLSALAVGIDDTISLGMAIAGELRLGLDEAVYFNVLSIKWLPDRGQIEMLVVG